MATITMVCCVLNDILRTKYSHFVIDEYMGQIQLHAYDQDESNLTREAKDKRGSAGP